MVNFKDVIFAALGRKKATPQEPVTERSVGADAREQWYLSLPYKIQPKQVLNILRAALAGDIWQQWQLLSMMQDTWPTFRMALHQLREAASYTNYQIHPFTIEGQEPSKKAIEKARLVERALKGMCPDGFNDERGYSGAIYDMTEAIANGISMQEIIWQDQPSKSPDGGWERLPKAVVFVNPRHFTFDNRGSVLLSSPVGVETAMRFPQQEQFGKIPDPDKFICSQFMSRSGSSLGAGLMRPLAWWWSARIFGLDFVLRSAQNFGSPFVDVTYKAGMSPEERAQLVAEIARGLGNRVLAHVEGSLLNVHPSTNLGTENPQRWLIDESNKECLFLLLGQAGTTQAVAGSLGNQDAHGEVKQERIAGVANWVARNPLRQFARAVLRVNYGNDEECPNIVADFTKPLTTAEVGQLASSIMLSGLPVKADEFYKKIGFTKPEPQDTIISRGEIQIIEEPLTPTEKKEKEFELQVQEQQFLGGGGNEPTQAKEHKINRDRSLLQDLTDKQLDEVEELVRACENATHVNGEVAALNRKLKEYERQRYRTK